MFDANRVIDIEDIERYSAHGGLCMHDWSIPEEVVNPAVISGMEVSCQLLRDWVDSSNVWALARITTEAASGEVCSNSETLVLLDDDVIDAKWKRVIRAGKTAILATVPGTQQNRAT